MPHIQQHLLAVPPLSPNNAVKLFFAMRPRDLPYSEFGCHSMDAEEAARVLGRHEVVRLMEGVPRRIWRVVAMLGEGGMRMDQPRLLESVRAMIAEEKDEEAKRRQRYRPPPPPQREEDESLLQTINRNSERMGTARPMSADATSVTPNKTLFPALSSQPSLSPSATGMPASLSPSVASSHFVSPAAASVWREHARDALSVPYQQLERPLLTHFSTFCSSPARPLSSDDLAVVRKKAAACCAESGADTRSAGLVNVAAFNRFWLWLSTLEWTVQRCRGVWISAQSAGGDEADALPPALHSFLTREQSASLLLSMADRPHPFLLRLSESQSGCLTVCWLQRPNHSQPPQIMYTLIHVQSDEEGGGFSIELDGGGRQRYASLSELILNYAAFETVMLCRSPATSQYQTLHKTRIFSVDRF